MENELELEWAPSAHAHMPGLVWRATPQDWIVEANGCYCLDGYDIGFLHQDDTESGPEISGAGSVKVDQIELQNGQMVNFDSRVKGVPESNVVEFITHIFADGYLTNTTTQPQKAV